MTRALCAVVLAAGAGTRLLPITADRPKALCPVGNVALLDRALTRLAHHGLSGPALVAVNACHLADQVVAHVGGRAFVSVEPTALGTAGALARLRDWVAGRAVLVGNVDAYLAPRTATSTDLAPLLAGWDPSMVRVLGVPSDAGGDHRPAEFGRLRFAGFSLIPPAVVGALSPVPSDLVFEVWRPAEREGRLAVVGYDGLYLDAGTLADYLAANLHAAGPGSIIAPDAVVSGTVEHSVIGAGARVHGGVRRCVVLPNACVGADERLTDSIRVAGNVTVTVGR